MDVTSIENLAPNQASFARHARVSKLVKRRIKHLAREWGMARIDVANRLQSDPRQLDLLRKEILSDDEMQFISTDDIHKMIGYAVNT